MKLVFKEIPVVKRVLPSTSIPLGPNQLGLILTENKAKQALYNWAVIVNIHGKLNVNAFEEALKFLIKRHEAFRMKYDLSKNLQEVTAVDFVQWQLEKESISEANVDSLSEQYAQIPFNFESGMLARSKLFTTGEDQYRWVFIAHHSIFDGTSQAIFLKELSTVYTQIVNNQSPSLPNVPVHYPDFCVWQHKMLEECQETQVKFWENKAADYASTRIPPDFDCQKETYKGKRVPVRIDLATHDKLVSVANSYKSTLYVVLLGALKTLLRKHLQTQSTMIASVNANRKKNEAVLGNTIGYFANTFLIPDTCADEMEFSQYCVNLDNTLRHELYQNLDLPFSCIASRYKVNIMFVLQNKDYQTLNLPGVETQAMEDGWGFSRFDLTLELRETNTGMTGFFEYNPDIYDASTISRLANNFCILLNQIILNPTGRASEYYVLSDEDKKLIMEWQGTKQDYPENKGIHEVFKDIANEFPDKIALSFQGKNISYKELDKQADFFAMQLATKHNIVSGGCVGVCCSYSIGSIVALLGILKAGGTVVPVDLIEGDNFSAQKEKIDFLKLTHIVAEGANKAGLLKHTANIDIIDMPEVSVPVENISVDSSIFNHHSSKSNAFIMFTSGTTGAKKCIPQTHQPYVNWATELHKYILATDNVYLSSPYTFDAAQWQIFSVTLLQGATLHMLRSGEHLLEDNVYSYFNDKKISVGTFTPSFMRTLDPKKFKGLRLVFAVGEHLPKHLSDEWIAAGITVVDGYGPTEVGVGSHLDKCSNEKLITVGKPIPNLRCYVLQGNLRAPIGAWGEICIAGVGVSYYLGNATLTQEKFPPDILFPDEKMFRTGDLGRLTYDGRLECAGRLDRQIKLHGVRIEPQEIEAILKTHPNVQDAVICVQHTSQDNDALVAFIVLKDRNAPSQNLHRTLAEHLICSGIAGTKLPRYFKVIDKIPYTAHGKLDEVNLSKIPVTSEASRTIVGARDDMDRQVIASITHCTNIAAASISIDDTLPLIGCDSLTRMRIAAQLNSKFPLSVEQRLPLMHIHTKTIQEISDFLSARLNKSKRSRKFVSLYNLNLNPK